MVFMTYEESTDTGSTTSETQWDSSPENSPQGLDEATPEPPAPKKRIAKLLQKTSFCKHHLRGHCRFGDKCAYAHEAKELVDKPDLTNTRMCARFMAGRCNTDRCSYSHACETVGQQPEAAFSPPSTTAYMDQPAFISPWQLEACKNTKGPSSPTIEVSSPPLLSADVHAILQATMQLPMKLNGNLEGMGELKQNGQAPQPRAIPAKQLGLQPGLQPGLRCKAGQSGQDARSGWRQVAEQMTESPPLQQQSLFEWLRSCEHTKQLPLNTELEIAQLFVNDGAMAARFPRLSQQCMGRLVDHLQTAWEAPGSGDVFSI